MTKVLLAAFRVAFIVASIGVLLLALLPEQPLGQFGFPTGFRSDKLNHISAFTALAGLGILGWPKRLARLVILLIVAGALIEILQGLPLIGRDRDIFDWLADCFGIALGVAGGLCLQRVIVAGRKAAGRRTAAGANDV